MPQSDVSDETTIVGGAGVPGGGVVGGLSDIVGADWWWSCESRPSEVGELVYKSRESMKLGVSNEFDRDGNVLE